MTTPPVGTAMAVICHTCGANVWQGNIAPTDGQVLLSAFANSVAGTACPSKVDPCPNKTASITAAQQLRSVTKAELAALIARIQAKVGPLP